MATFNLTANVWHLASTDAVIQAFEKPVGPPDLITSAGLIGVPKGLDTVVIPTGIPVGSFGIPSKLIVPPRTDIRGCYYVSGDFAPYKIDVVQIPDNRDHWYAMFGWYDVSRGYPEEFRAGIIYPLKEWWPAPPWD